MRESVGHRPSVRSEVKGIQAGSSIQSTETPSRGFLCVHRCYIHIVWDLTIFSPDEQVSTIQAMNLTWIGEMQRWDWLDKAEYEGNQGPTRAGFFRLTPVLARDVRFLQTAVQTTIIQIYLNKRNGPTRIYGTCSERPKGPLEKIEEAGNTSCLEEGKDTCIR